MTGTLDENQIFWDNTQVIRGGMKLFEAKFQCLPNCFSWDSENKQSYDKYRHLLELRFQLKPLRRDGEHPGFFHIGRWEHPEHYISIDLKELRP